MISIYIFQEIATATGFSKKITNWINFIFDVDTLNSGIHSGITSFLLKQIINVYINEKCQLNWEGNFNCFLKTTIQKMHLFVYFSKK
jgi:hypothetical protein